MSLAHRSASALFALSLAACATSAPTPPPPSAAPQEAAPQAAAPQPAAPAAETQAPAKPEAPVVDAAPVAIAPPPATTYEPNVAGGYSSADIASPKIQSAAAEAVKLLQASKKDSSITLVAIRSAETQVVAGQNIRMKLDLKTAAGPRSVTVVLYKDLSGKGTLTSIEGL